MTTQTASANPHYVRESAAAEGFPVLLIEATEEGTRSLYTTKETVTCRTQAVRLARSLGHRVMTVGGLVDMVQINTADGEPDAWAWGVTVHPDKRV